MRSSIFGRTALAAAITTGIAVCTPVSYATTDETTSGKMSTSKTQDIVNTLRNRGSFHRMLDGLQMAFDMDNTLKGKGPFTVFAADDKAWAKLNQTDQDTLFANKTKLKQVLSYQILQGAQLDSKALKVMQSAKTMEGSDIHLSYKEGDDKKTDGLFVDKARVKNADILCSNGIIHIVDEPIMPPLKR